MRSALPVLALVACLTGCNRYDLFRIAGFEQQSFSNKADVLFVIDNSDSMLEEAESLATNFNNFILNLQTFEEELQTDDLGDAVDNYVDYVQNRGAFVDYQFGITTTDVEATGGELVGPLIKRGEPDIAAGFTENLLCEATCFRDDLALPTDPDHQCGEPLGNTVTQEYMDCTCGNSYRGNCGAAVEEGLEAVFLAMCRAVPNPPVECFADVNNGEEEFPAILTQNDTLSNEGMLRDNANFIPVIVSDEGDGSRRMNREQTAEAYRDAFAKFNRRMSWVVIAPGLDDDLTVTCPGTATDYGVVRYNWMAFTTDGLSIDIFDANCTTQDFDTALEAVGDLLNNLLTSFPLQSVPDPQSIIVLVEGSELERASVVAQDQFGFDVYSNGWTYRVQDNAVVFHGASIPTYEQDVDVYYMPIDGMPRELPF